MNLLSLTLSSKVSRERGGRSGEGNYPRWLERLLVLGTLGRPRPAPTTGKEGLEPSEGGRGCLPRNFPFLVAGERASAGALSLYGKQAGNGEEGRERVDERPRKMKASIHPSSTERRQHNSYNIPGAPREGERNQQAMVDGGQSELQ